MSNYIIKDTLPKFGNVEVGASVVGKVGWAICGVIWQKSALKDKSSIAISL